MIPTTSSTSSTLSSTSSSTSSSTFTSTSSTSSTAATTTTSSSFSSFSSFSSSSSSLSLSLSQHCPVLDSCAGGSSWKLIVAPSSGHSMGAVRWQTHGVSVWLCIHAARSQNLPAEPRGAATPRQSLSTLWRPEFTSVSTIGLAEIPIRQRLSLASILGGMSTRAVVFGYPDN
ncbi:hypothetical protein EYF80_002349 [Liparis tanakae]|uniref:Uncharacterized protein n=1 Tax=Liparis tanakae TaxID=230148 RepID=A0A4Z2JAW7_9TELE|nr:hypothetical protein EYF80_002349 [Liparis tanakae]